MSRIHPETGCRLPPLNWDDLDEPGRPAYDRQLDPAHGSIVGLSGRDALIISIGRELFGKRKLSPGFYDRAIAHFGERGVGELITLTAT